MAPDTLSVEGYFEAYVEDHHQARAEDHDPELAEFYPLAASEGGLEDKETVPLDGEVLSPDPEGEGAGAAKGSDLDKDPDI